MITYFEMTPEGQLVEGTSEKKVPTGFILKHQLNMRCTISLKKIPLTSGVI